MYELKREKSYRAECEFRFTFDKPDEEHNIVQGGYYDGKNYYIAMVKRAEDGHEFTRILVLDRDGKTVRLGDEIRVDHANNLTYVPKKNAFLVSHCQAPEGNNARYSWIDRETLTASGTDDLPHPFFSMAYDPETDRFASGEWGGETIDTWNGDLTCAGTFAVEQPRSLSQGVYCDREHIWFVRSSRRGAGAEIRIYDWQGEIEHIIPLDLEHRIEPESINIAGNEIVIVCNRPTYDGGLCYTVRLEEKL